ncbi:MAG: hypothetical protein RL328_510 [Acidobacteriota bacterium]|jgi:hypothetical protein
MDLSYILGQLYEERKRVNEVILTLEKLVDGIQNRQKMAPGLKSLETLARKRQVTPETRAKLARAQRKRWAASKKAQS